MNEAHEHDTADVHFLVCVLAQEVSHDGHMPGMFGIILVPAVARQVGLTENILFFVDFQRKSQLFCKAFVLTHKLICLFFYFYGSVAVPRAGSDFSGQPQKVILLQKSYDNILMKVIL